MAAASTGSCGVKRTSERERDAAGQVEHWRRGAECEHYGHVAQHAGVAVGERELWWHVGGVDVGLREMGAADGAAEHRNEEILHGAGSLG